MHQSLLIRKGAGFSDSVLRIGRHIHQALFTDGFMQSGPQSANAPHSSARAVLRQTFMQWELMSTARLLRMCPLPAPMT
jgi:hypothetical protein